MKSVAPAGAAWDFINVLLTCICMIVQYKRRHSIYKESPKFASNDQWTNGDNCLYCVETDKTIFRNLLARVWTLLHVFGSPIIANWADFGLFMDIGLSPQNARFFNKLQRSNKTPNWNLQRSNKTPNWNLPKFWSLSIVKALRSENEFSTIWDCHNAIPRASCVDKNHKTLLFEQNAYQAELIASLCPSSGAG